METVLNKVKALPLSVKIGEILSVLSLVIYIIMVIDGGSFTTYYALMGAIVIGVIAAIIAVLKKRFVLTLINLAVPTLMFLHFISVA